MKKKTFSKESSVASKKIFCSDVSVLITCSGRDVEGTLQFFLAHFFTAFIYCGVSGKGDRCAAKGCRLGVEPAPAAGAL